MSEKTKHTFAICAYKESPYLEECILSLMHQTVSSHVYISTSTPNEHIDQIAQRYDLKVYVSPGGGIGNDWNSALSHADSQYVTIAHQDDVYLSTYTERILRAFELDSDGILAFSGYQEIYNEKVLPKNINLRIKDLLLLPLKGKGKSKFSKRVSLAFGSAICCPAVTYNMDKLGNFCFGNNMRSNIDWAAWEKLSKKSGAFLYCPGTFMLHRIHDESETSNMIRENLRQYEDFEMFRRFWPRPIAKFLTSIYKNSEKGNIK